MDCLYTDDCEECRVIMNSCKHCSKEYQTVMHGSYFIESYYCDDCKAYEEQELYEARGVIRSVERNSLPTHDRPFVKGEFRWLWDEAKIERKR